MCVLQSCSLSLLSAVCFIICAPEGPPGACGSSRGQLVWVSLCCWRASTPCQHADSAPFLPLQAFASVNWVLSEEQFDLETDLAFSFLDYLLLGTSAAPLRRALMESGLGESLIGGGLSGELRQPIFSLGLKGVAPDNADKVSCCCRWTPPLAPLRLSCRCSSSWCPGCG